MSDWDLSSSDDEEVAPSPLISQENVRPKVLPPPGYVKQVSSDTYSATESPQDLKRRLEEEAKRQAVNDLFGEFSMADEAKRFKEEQQRRKEEIALINARKAWVENYPIEVNLWEDYKLHNSKSLRHLMTTVASKFEVKPIGDQHEAPQVEPTLSAHECKLKGARAKFFELLMHRVIPTMPINDVVMVERSLTQIREKKKKMAGVYAASKVATKGAQDNLKEDLDDEDSEKEDGGEEGGFGEYKWVWNGEWWQQYSWDTYEWVKVEPKTLSILVNGEWESYSWYDNWWHPEDESPMDPGKKWELVELGSEFGWTYYTSPSGGQDEDDWVAVNQTDNWLQTSCGSWANLKLILGEWVLNHDREDEPVDVVDMDEAERMFLEMDDDF